MGCSEGWDGGVQRAGMWGVQRAGKWGVLE